MESSSDCFKYFDEKFKLTRYTVPITAYPSGVGCHIQADVPHCAVCPDPSGWARRRPRILGDSHACVNQTVDSQRQPNLTPICIQRSPSLIRPPIHRNPLPLEEISDARRTSTVTALGGCSLQPVICHPDDDTDGASFQLANLVDFSGFWCALYWAILVWEQTTFICDKLLSWI